MSQEPGPRLAARGDGPGSQAPVLNRLPDVPASSASLTVLVAALDEADNIGTFIDSFLRLSYENKELVLCAGGNDGTYERAMARTGGSVRVLRQDVGEGKQSALRKAFRFATGEIIVLTDADTVLTDEAMSNLVAPILAGREKATSGTSRPKASQLAHTFVLYQYALEWIGLGRMDGTRYLTSMLGRNSAVLRSVLEEVGEFAEDVPTGTDSFLAKKIVNHGYRIRFVRDSVVETDYATSLWEYCRQRSRWRRNGILHSLRFGLYGRLVKVLIPSIIGLSLFLLPVLSVWLGPVVLLAWASLIIFVYVRHIGYMRLFLVSRRLPFTAGIWGKVAIYMWAEWGAHVLALLQLPSARLRSSW